MKDLEKIKSEDLGCQVADANPGNFGIEQEVAAMVGATVPAPTEPSADDARELGAQLLVFLRRALTPIQSALRTALAAIYAHLDSRCTDYTPAAYAPYIPRPYDPMGTPPTSRSVANLLTAITAFSARKISNGSAPNDGIPDGVSLARLLASSAANSVTKLIDDQHGWVCNKAYPNNPFPNLEKAVLNMKSITAANALTYLSAEEIEFPELETVASGSSQYNDPMPMNAKKISAPLLKTSDAIFSQRQYKAEIVEFNELTTMNGRCFYDNLVSGGAPLRELYIPKVTNYGDTWGFLRGSFPNLILIETGSNVSFSLANWNPTNVLADADKTATFLQNFKEHIALRLTANGSGKTLTLSQAVRNAIHAAESTYGIENIIVTQKGWTISPAPN